MNKRWIYISLAVIMTATLLLASCKPAAQPTATEPVSQPEVTNTPAEPKSATITFFEEPDSLNPLYTDMWFSVIAMDLYLNGLWFYDDNLTMVPELAAEIPSMSNGGISADGKVLTIKLNPKASWSDGVPVTADDFIFTFDMIMSDKNLIQSRYPYEDYVESVVALDANTLQISMSEPFVPWGVYLFRWLLPKHVLEPVFQADGTIDNADWNRNPTVGVGPFVFKEWQSASHIVFEANPNYWRGKPHLDKIFIRIVPDTEAQMAAIQTGDTDFGVFLSAADKPTIDTLPDVDMVSVISGYIESWFFNLDPNTGHIGLQDPDVRKAIVMGVNRQQIIDELYYGLYEIPATFWSGMPYEDPTLVPLAYDPDGAKALLDAAGWIDSNGDGTRDKDGVELILRYSTTAGHELREATQVVIQNMLKEIGVGIEILNYSYDTIWNSYGDGGPIAVGDYDIAEWSDGPAFPDPDTYYWLCSEIPSDDYPDGGNWYGVCDTEMDQLFQDQAVTVDTDARTNMFYKIGDIMANQNYWVGLRTDPDLWSVNKRVINVRLSGPNPFWNSFDWDIGS